METTGEEAVPTKEEVKELLRRYNSGAYSLVSLGKEDSQWGEGWAGARFQRALYPASLFIFQKEPEPYLTHVGKLLKDFTHGSNTVRCLL